MRTERLKLAAVGAVAMFGLGLIASGCSPEQAATVATPPAAHGGRTSVVLPGSTPSIAVAPPPTPAAAAPPTPAHVVIVVEDQAFGADAPFLASLRAGGASFANSRVVNHLALFSGSTQGVTTDDCVSPVRAPNLASQLAAHGKTFIGYAESMPSDGYTGCRSGDYDRANAPWTAFANVKPSASLRFARFPSAFDRLPTVSWVAPAPGDTWLKQNLGAYAKWAKTHHSLLIVIGDKMPLVISGTGVQPGAYRAKVDGYSVLRLVQSLYGLPCLAKSCAAKPITGIWR